jgi:MFS family permease
MFFLNDVLRVPNPATVTTYLTAVMFIFLLISSLLGGNISDKVGRKKLLAAAGLLAMVGTVLLVFSRTIPMVIFSGVFLGLGTGTFMATNWALGTDLVPAGEAGRFLGISNLAGAGAGIIGSSIGGPLADYFNAIQPGLGYPVIFALYGGLFLLSVLLLPRIKNTRIQ